MAEYTYRNQKGSPLTYQELDNNFKNVDETKATLDQSVSDAAASALEAFGYAQQTATDASQTFQDTIQTGIDRAAADAAALLSQNWASKTNGAVDGLDYSSKNYAIGGTFPPPLGSSKDWASKTDGTVDGVEYSAKDYAVGGTVSPPVGSAKDWATKIDGEVVVGQFSAKKYAMDTAGAAASIGNSVSAAQSAAAIAQQIALFTSSSALDSKAAQTLALPANTYNNGTLGVGATLTANANGALTTATYFDNVTINVGDTVFIRLEPAGRNWLYTFTQQGTASLPWIFTRLAASDTAAEIGNAVTNVLPGGALYGSTKWRVDQAAGAITVGTTQLTFSTQAAAVAAESAIRAAADKARDGALQISSMPGQGRVVVVDSQNNLFGYIGAEGIDFTDFNAAEASVNRLVKTSPSFDKIPGNGAFVVTDDTGRVRWKVTDDLVDHPDVNAIRTTVASLGDASAANAVAPLGQIMHFVTEGQSLSIDTASDGSPTGVIAGGLMFQNALRVDEAPSESPSTWGGIVPLQAIRPSHMTGMMQRINERLIADTGSDLASVGQNILFTSLGRGGQSTNELLAEPFPTRRINVSTKGASEAAILGKSYNPAAYTIIQGENDIATPPETFYSRWMTMYNQWLAQATISRGAARPVPIAIYQTSCFIGGSWFPSVVADAYLWFQERNPFGLFSCPIYFLPYSGGDQGLHLTSNGYKWLGAYFGDCFYDLMWKRYRRPVLRPTIERLNSNTIGLRYKLRPGARLVFDNSVTTQFGVTLAQKGIRVSRIDDLAFAQPTEIPCSVNIVGSDCIELVGNTAIPGDGSYDIKTGWFGSAFRNYTELRDNAGDLLPTFDPAGINKKLHNWFPVNRTTILL